MSEHLNHYDFQVITVRCKVEVPESYPDFCPGGKQPLLHTKGGACVPLAVLCLVAESYPTLCYPTNC